MLVRNKNERGERDTIRDLTDGECDIHAPYTFVMWVESSVAASFLSWGGEESLSSINELFLQQNMGRQSDCCISVRERLSG